MAWPGTDALVCASFRTVERSRSAGGFPPRSLARQLLPYWVVLRLGRGAGLGVSLGRRSRAGSKREPVSRGLHFTELWSSPFFHSNFRKRSFCGSSSCAPLVSRVRASFEVDVCSVNRCICVEDPFYRILFSSLLQGVCTSPSAPQPLGKGYDGNKGGEARWKRKPSSSDAGVPVPVPCSPRTRHFRRHRAL